MSRCIFAEWAPIIGAPGGTYITNAPWRTVLHTFEVKGDYRYNPAKYGSGATPPHFTVSVTPGRIHQHVNTASSAYALRNYQNIPGETNRTRAIQIELMWQAGDTPNMPQSLIDNLNRLLDWIYVEHPHGATVLPFHQYPPEDGIRLDGNEPWRLTAAQWLEFSGLCGHQHIPENNHGDPGLVPIDRIRVPVPPPPKLPEVKPMWDPALQLEPIVADCPCPAGGAWLLAASGAVYAFGGAPYLGAPNLHPYWGERVAARIEPHQSGYVITATSGETYHYGPAA